MIFLGSILGSILGSAAAILFAGLGMTYNLDSKIQSNSTKSDAKFESLRSELLNAFSNAQGERIRALEVAAAERKKYW